MVLIEMKRGMLLAPALLSDLNNNFCLNMVMCDVSTALLGTLERLALYPGSYY